ncbi:uncharacterized protein ACNLHF_028081 isoform 2-T2 [Anomaloglossus baeobatrachus]
MENDCVCITSDTEFSPAAHTEKECFICRQTEKQGQERLENFCDCTDLSVHHQCLLSWIQKGSGNENRQQCSACTAKTDPKKRRKKTPKPYSPDAERVDLQWKASRTCSGKHQGPVVETAVHKHSPSNLTQLELSAKEEWARISVS